MQIEALKKTVVVKIPQFRRANVNFSVRPLTGDDKLRALRRPRVRMLYIRLTHP